MAGTAAMLNCSTGVLHKTTSPPFATTRTSGEPSTSSISRLHLRSRRCGGRKVTLNMAGTRRDRVVGRVRASYGGDGDNVRELASEKAVEGGPELVDDTKKLANGQNPLAFDAKAEDAADAASDDGQVREKVVDVASDTAVDSWTNVEEVAKNDAAGLADQLGQTVEDTAVGLEVKAKQVSDREARKESLDSTSSSQSPQSFFQDQVIKDPQELRRDMVTIEELDARASKLEAERSGSNGQSGSNPSSDGDTKDPRPVLEDLTRSFSKNLKEGIDGTRPGIEEISKNVAKGVKIGRENLEYGAEGAVETGAYAREGLDVAKGALDKRLKVVNLAAQEARETGSMVAELAAKGWDALSKTTERFVDRFQKNVRSAQANAERTVENTRSVVEEKVGEARKNAAELQDTAQEKAGQAKDKAQELSENAQKKFDEAQKTASEKMDGLSRDAQAKAAESKSKLEETTEKAQSKAGEISSSTKKKLGEAQETAEAKARDAKENLGSASNATDEDTFANAVDKMAQNYEDEPGNDQIATHGSSVSGETRRLQAETDPVPPENDDEWTGKANLN